MFLTDGQVLLWLLAPGPMKAKAKFSALSPGLADSYRLRTASHYPQDADTLTGTYSQIQRT